MERYDGCASHIEGRRGARSKLKGLILEVRERVMNRNQRKRRVNRGVGFRSWAEKVEIKFLATWLC